MKGSFPKSCGVSVHKQSEGHAFAHCRPISSWQHVILLKYDRPPVHGRSVITSTAIERRWNQSKTEHAWRVLPFWNEPTLLLSNVSFGSSSAWLLVASPLSDAWSL